MTGWLGHFALTLLSTCRDLLPIVGIIIAFQMLVIRKPITHPKRTLIGFAYVTLGIAFFLEGLELALFPLGKLMATQLTSSEFLNIKPNQHTIPWLTYKWVYVFAASIGFATTFAEPSLLAVSMKAEQISGGAIKSLGLRVAVSIGVAFGIALGAFRIVTGTELYFYIISGYIVVIIQTLFSPKMIIGLAYDSGGVTTSTVTVPLVTALGLGLAQAVPGRNPLIDGFGLIAFASLFPIITVLGYAQIAQWLNNRKQKQHPT
ncbi:Na(+), Li(+), K(+)/H(+) antiporter subunit B [biofilm metagenome]